MLGFSPISARPISALPRVQEAAAPVIEELHGPFMGKKKRLKQPEVVAPAINDDDDVMAIVNWFLENVG